MIYQPEADFHKLPEEMRWRNMRRASRQQDFRPESEQVEEAGAFERRLAA